MKEFAIEVKKIEKVWAHPNANAMQMAKVKGFAYQFVVGLNVKVNDLVVYFPLESIIPIKIQKLMPDAITSKLGGKSNDRVVTAKLRGQISQGIAIPITEFKFKMPFWKFYKNWQVEGYDLTKELGVTKFELPPIVIPNAKLFKLPPDCPRYKIASSDTNEEILALLMNMEVVITEKLEGQNHAIIADKNGGMSVCQHAYEIQPDAGKILDIPAWQATVSTGLGVATTKIGAILLGNTIIVRSELIGINPAFKNYYELSETTLRVFEIDLNGLPMDFDIEQEYIKKFDMPYVPILARGILKDILKEKTIKEYADGMSKINPNKRREGIIVRPIREQQHPTLGRLMLKQHSAKYLLKQK